ncbi:VPLPA-CTERM-specific exosortase XrtD [Nitrospira moscoviensis]|uniref:Methanolan biosynthesis EpsI domain-containing protein n=1 Tax=Nitrospira moscoviensis TaxID=42253 RepID=A0A0K2GJM3_NITMO|nr:VPLPA-CTERM-specific exosortase XrtD [Nitrospira moscoviensis]ALA61136.1 conserved membrane protein of unknown function [Nitrospira moscoviensis]
MNLSGSDVASKIVQPLLSKPARLPSATWPGTWIIANGLCLPLLLGLVYFDALSEMVRVWSEDENYGHGFFVPFISLFLLWMKRDQIISIERRGSWWGLPIMLLAIGLYGLGEFGTVYALLQLSFWLMLVGLALSAFGRDILRPAGFPLLYLLTMIPLPQFLFQGLSGQLQLLSSALGVGCLQLVGVTAFREGNVIDLGPIQLQVVEACSGLRYLFPLMSLALLCAYLFHAPLWKRFTVFLCSMPIAILLNGLRIGVVGVLVDIFGAGAAEGFLHLFEGWVIFLMSLAVLLGVMWGLSRIGTSAERTAWSNLVLIPSPQRSGRPDDRAALFAGAMPAPLLCGVGLLAITAMASPYLMSREEQAPIREPLLGFPLQVERWQGTVFPLEREYIDALRFDDYLLADYRAGGESVNFYVAYYQSQRKGQSAHSPRTCIPGGGWEITSLQTVAVPMMEGSSQSLLPVNRVAIQKGDAKQVVYYWFKQRDRLLTNEYLVKVYLFWDAVTKGRTDGALIRLAAAVRPGQDEHDADGLLQDFVRAVQPAITRYVPD